MLINKLLKHRPDSNSLPMGKGVNISFPAIISIISLGFISAAQAEPQPAVSYVFDNNLLELNGGSSAVNSNCSTSFTTDRFGLDNKAVQFNGMNDYLTITNNDALKIQQYTVSLWIRPDALNYNDWQGIVGKPGRNMNI